MIRFKISRREIAQVRGFTQAAGDITLTMIESMPPRLLLTVGDRELELGTCITPAQPLEEAIAEALELVEADEERMHSQGKATRADFTLMYGDGDLPVEPLEVEDPAAAARQQYNDAIRRELQ
jgi:hypothetical protein